MPALTPRSPKRSRRSPPTSGTHPPRRQGGRGALRAGPRDAAARCSARPPPLPRHVAALQLRAHADGEGECGRAEALGAEALKGRGTTLPGAARWLRRRARARPVPTGRRGCRRGRASAAREPGSASAAPCRPTTGCSRRTELSRRSLARQHRTRKRCRCSRPLRRMARALRRRPSAHEGRRPASRPPREVCWGSGLDFVHYGVRFVQPESRPDPKYPDLALTVQSPDLTPNSDPIFSGHDVPALVPAAAALPQGIRSCAAPEKRPAPPAGHAPAAGAEARGHCGLIAPSS